MRSALFIVATLLCDLAPPNGVEIPAAMKPAASPCSEYGFGALAVRGCGNDLSFLVDGKPVRKPMKLGDMNLKGARAFNDGASIVVVVDVGDEGNSSLDFYRITARTLAPLGTFPIMVDSDDISALPLLSIERSKAGLDLTFKGPVVKDAGDGSYPALRSPRIHIGKGKAKLVEAPRPSTK